ncbi:MAG: ATP phosphoribosyltransferase regulatory subunit, partial [Gammaproteobacteria bacterium]
MLRVAGLEYFHIDLGHVGIFRSLAKDAGLNQEQEVVLFDALQRKAKPEIAELLTAWSLAPKQRSMISALVDLNGGIEVLQEARRVFAAAGKDVHTALDNLQQMAEAAQCQLATIQLHYDLAELRGYRYLSGVVFAAFAPGHSMEIARGGRYDEIGRLFGRTRPATGFSSDLKTLLALNPLTAPQASGILAPPWSDDDGLRDLIRRLRNRGERVLFFLPGQEDDPVAMGCDRRIEERDGQWVVVPLVGKC